jgi:tRNA (guanosine-2'-O-)-methyltransferase
VQQLTGTGLKRLHREWRRRKAARLALMLEAVDSPFNVGSIVRTAAAMAADDLYLVRVGAAPNSPKVQKAAMGTQRYLRWRDFGTVADAVAQARADGYLVVGLELAEGAQPLADLDAAGDVCLVLGHEDRGLSRDALAACDAVAFIPQFGRVGSLGVAAAAAVGAYEVRRQQLGRSSAPQSSA